MKLKPGEARKTLSGWRYGVQQGGDIITINCNPPIPTRDWDWCAYKDGDDEKPWMYGWGTTEQAALRDWRRMQQEAFEATQPHGDCID
jgi:hypothetical protein